MNPAGAQRWLFRRHSFRPLGETINPRDYDVSAMAGDTEPKAFVLAHHYSRSYPAARWRFGLHRRGQLCGVAVFSHPASDRVLTNVFPGNALDSVELGRFVLTNDVPANGETWFLGQCFAGLRREGLGGVVSFADPTAREAADGSIIFPGHVGTIYQAHNGQYCGRSTARTLRLLPDGAVLSARAIQKVRAWERGAAYVVDQLLSAGAPAFDAGDRAGWLTAALAATTRPLRHPGNHRYAWALRRSCSIALPKQTYPKKETR